ncbi:hypothetical protein [Thalassospira povalilytica]|uniref:hypothetical protein n=1 Tax=Thalassospira povalilytica TaxID=732237 RepID=UPI001D189EFD|nr:hypothetical protein [Thalassospira povalilytica]MCC4240918.1 hypothetical protein [Thalassospira povalilytica]
MSDLPAPGTKIDGIIRWAKDQLGRQPTEGEVTVVRVAMEMKRRRQQDRRERRQQALEAAAVRRRQDDQQAENDFKKRLEREIDDLWVWAICLIRLSDLATDWQRSAKASKALVLRTNPIAVIDAGLAFKAQETSISFEPEPQQQHRALLAYIAAKMPELAPGLPSPLPSWGIDRPGYYDVDLHTKADLPLAALSLINAQQPHYVTKIFRRLVAVSPFDSGKVIDEIVREGEIEREKIMSDHRAPQAFAFDPETPPLSILPEPKPKDVDELLAEDQPDIDELLAEAEEFQP